MIKEKKDRFVGMYDATGRWSPPPVVQRPGLIRAAAGAVSTGVMNLATCTGTTTRTSPAAPFSPRRHVLRGAVFADEQWCVRGHSPLPRHRRGRPGSIPPARPRSPEGIRIRSFGSAGRASSLRVYRLIWATPFPARSGGDTRAMIASSGWQAGLMELFAYGTDVARRRSTS